MLWRSIVLVAALVGFNLAWAAAAGTVVERLIIETMTVKPAVFVVNLLTPDAAAQAVRWSIRAPGGGLNIQVGCDGMELVLLLSAAFLAAPLGWRARSVGLAIGLPSIYVLNQLRILLLFYVNRADKSWFAVLHETLLPVALIALIAAYFYAWVVRDTRPPA